MQNLIETYSSSSSEWVSSVSQSVCQAALSVFPPNSLQTPEKYNQKAEKIAQAQQNRQYISK